MKKRFALPIVSVAVVGLMAAFASPAMAFPTQSKTCTTCHSGPVVGVVATLASTTGSNATYDFSAPTANAVAVFDGATKLFTFTTATGQFTVPVGKTYTVYAVTGPTTTDGIGSTTVSPAAAPADTTPPVTTSDAKSTYVASATIKLTAIDTGSGVANTYYKLDGGAQTAGTTIVVSTLGAHTIEFWSVDVAGNVEAHTTTGFTVQAPPVVPDTTAPVTTSDVKSTYVAMATIKLTATDAGSGVAATYYILDGGTQTAGSTVSTNTLGSHTLEFWSVDTSGNVETHKTAGFSITAPVVVPPVTAHNVKVHVRVAKGHTKGLTAILTNSTTGARFTARINKRGDASFTGVPSGTYRLTVKGKGVRFSARTIVVGDLDVNVSGLRALLKHHDD
jgi:hypothetical protein